MTAPRTAPRQDARLVDSHCHLDFADFEDDRASFVRDAARAGVTRMVTICTAMGRVPEVRAIAEAHTGVYWAAGSHPMHVADNPMVTVDELVEVAGHPKMVGIGETGLDYHYTRQSAAQQRESLALHIEVARRTGLPLIIHARDADDDIARILSKEHAAGAFDCVMHCFSSGRRLAETALGLGFYLSMSGIAAFPKSDELRAIFADAPLERILVETDSPYLAPPPYRGKRCQPAYVTHTAKVGAEVHGISYDEFCRATSANFDRLFAKAAAHGEEAAS